MKKLIDFFARQGLFSELFTFLILGVGLFSLFNIKKEAFPNIQYDVLTIYTTFPGAAPSEVEKLITNPLEQELKEVNGIKKMTSTSMEGLSGIVIQLDSDQTDQKTAKLDVQEIIDRFKELPEEAEEPLVSALETKIFPIVEVAVSGTGAALDLKKSALYIENEIEKIHGVARVDLLGERKYEVRVEIPVRKLKEYQLSLMEVVSALREQNVSIPGGVFKKTEGNIKKDVIVRTEGQFENIDDIKMTVIRSNDMGQPILLKNVARISMGLDEEQTTHRVNGKDSIRLVVLKKENADAIKVISALKKRIKKGFKVKDIEIELVNDMSFLIKRRLKVLSNNLLVGLLLVILILSLFLPFRISLVTSIGIPFAFLGTMTFFQLQGISLNLITMMGLIIVIGMLVDDAVVITENSIRVMETGEKPMDSAVKGTVAIWPAVFASVMTTVLAFFPMTIMSGIFGKFIKFIPLGVICALIISLLECYFILPYHVGRWVKPIHLSKEKKGFKGSFDRFWKKMISLYGRLLSQIIRFRYLACLAFLVFFILSLFLTFHSMKVILFPPKGIDQFVVKIKAPIGTSLEQTSQMIKPLEKIISKLPKGEIKNFVTSIGEYRSRPDQYGERGSHYAQIMIYLTPELERDRTADEMISSLKDSFKLEKTENLEILFERANAGPPVGKPISIGVQGENYKEIMLVVDEIMEDLKKQKGVRDLTHNFSRGKDQVLIEVNSREAKSVGLSPASVGVTVMSAFRGLVATSIPGLDDEIDIRVSLPEEEKQGLNALDDLKILNSFGNLVPLKSIAKFKTEKGVETYFHENNRRQITITGDVDTDLTSAIEVSNFIRGQEKKYLSQHPGLNLNFSGEDEDTKESFKSLGRAIILAVILIYFLLIITFQSFIWPLIIILSVPVGAASVIWALFVHGQPISFMGMLAVVALAGVIVNNAIVFVDFVMKERKEGVDKKKSICLAGQKRLRPIILTSLTTVCGILPTAYGIGGLDPFIVPIALGLGWGMLVGSVISSLVLPAFIAVFDDLRGFVAHPKKRNESLTHLERTKGS